MDISVLSSKRVGALLDTEKIADEIVGYGARIGTSQQLQSLNEIAGGAKLHVQFSDDDLEDDLPLSLFLISRTVTSSSRSAVQDVSQPKWQERTQRNELFLCTYMIRTTIYSLFVGTATVGW